MAGADKVSIETGRDMEEKYRFGALTMSRIRRSNSDANVKAPTFACNISGGFFEIVVVRPEDCAYMKK